MAANGFIEIRRSTLVVLLAAIAFLLANHLRRKSCWERTQHDAARLKIDRSEWLHGLKTARNQLQAATTSRKICENEKEAILEDLIDTEIRLETALKDKMRALEDKLVLLEDHRKSEKALLDLLSLLDDVREDNEDKSRLLRAKDQALERAELEITELRSNLLEAEFGVMMDEY